jgi:ABC-type lipoprotein release transport system permease subunit
VGLVWVRARAELAARWRSALALTLLLGIGGGIALTALAGARRTDSAVGQFVQYSLPDQAGFLFGNLNSPPVTPGIPLTSRALSPEERRIVDLPQVAAWSRAPYLYVTTHRSGRRTVDLNVIGAGDPDYQHTLDRPLVLAGHLPDPNDPSLVTVNELAAAAEHLHVGSRLTLYAYAAAQFEGGKLNGGDIRIPRPRGPSYPVRVAAIVRQPQDVTAVAPLEARAGVLYEGDSNLYVTPAFLSRLAQGLGLPVQRFPDINLFTVRLRHGTADWNAFSAAAKRIAGAEVFTSRGNAYGVHVAARSAQRGIHLDVIALLLFGALAALVTLALVGQSVARQSVLERGDHAQLQILGATRAQLVGVVALRSGAIALAGAALAVVVAWLASPLMPVGLARQAEIHPGMSFDAAVLIPAALVLALGVCAWGVVPAWRALRRTSVLGVDGLPAHPSAVAAAVSRTVTRPSAGIGTRFALESGRGRAAVPVVTPMLGAALAVAVLGAALTFGTSLAHLVASPRQQGWNWDVLVGNPNDMTDRLAQDSRLLAQNRYVSGYSALALLASQGQGGSSIDGQSVATLLAIDPLKGAVYPPLLQGHAPEADDQIVLGTQTLDRLHRHVGQTVQIPTPDGTLTLHIVGRMIAPSVGDLFSNELGDGGWVYGPAVLKMERQEQAQRAAPGSNAAAPPIAFDMFAVRYAPGVSHQAAFASLQREFGPLVLRQLPSADVLNLQNVDRLPLILSGLVTLLGVATIGNTLFTSVRRRRRDLAVLKAIGFRPRQVAGVVAWQATTFSVVALVVGIPVGIVAGRWAWNAVASGIGTASPPVVPALLLAAVIPATVVVCNLLAALPGWSAARVPAALAMRTD